MKQTKNKEKLIQDIKKKLNTWNERSSFTLKGVKNLSKADLDILLLYCESNISSRYFSESVIQVLMAYDIDLL